MAILKRIQFEEDHVRVPNDTARHCEEKRHGQDAISLEALGLLTNIMCYAESWEIYKTELYKRYTKNKETSVSKAWKDLISAGYVIEYKYRSGRKWEYVYYVAIRPFTSEEKAEILDTARSEHSEIWGLDFPDLKMKTSKPRGNQKELNKTKLKQKDNKDYKQDIDDDKRTESSAIHNEDELNQIINNLREATKEDLTDRSFKAVLRKVMDKYNQGEIGEGKFRDYLVTSLSNKIEELERRRIKEEARSAMAVDKARSKKQIRDQLSTYEFKGTIPFYNWLEE